MIKIPCKLVTVSRVGIVNLFRLWLGVPKTLALGGLSIMISRALSESKRCNQVCMMPVHKGIFFDNKKKYLSNNIPSSCF